jgi:hypothetical protein
MAARRLLIIMLVLLGLSTLAAALVPQRTLREGSTSTSTAQSASTTTTARAPSILPPVAEITVGGKNRAGKKLFPVVPAPVGVQFTLLIHSQRPKEISIPEFGLLGFATLNTPARFELLPETPGTFGIVFAASGKAAGQIQILPQKKAKSRARAGSNPA